MTIRSFSDLALIEPLQRAVAQEGYTRPTPIQVKSIPDLLDGRDLLGCAQTGTGKTAAFALPILQRLTESTTRTRRLRALILTPTRELAAQIDESFRVYGRNLRLTTVVIFGGVSQHSQELALRRGVDILVATPGRLLDMMGQGLIRLNDLEIFVLDEADRMLDMGFIHDVKRVIAALPPRRQSMFFSATMPREAADLADELLHDPIRVSVTPQATPVERIDQRIMFVDKEDKNQLLSDLLDDPAVERVLVFTRTKHGANKVAKLLLRDHIEADVIHGNKSQNARTRAMEGFRKGNIRVLVATDIAARGIDVEGITHVINFDLPNEPESYVHRIGRTARAGAEGIAISFCSGDERVYLRDIERLIRRQIPVETDHRYHSKDATLGLVDGRTPEKPKQRGPRPSRINNTPRPQKPREDRPRPVRERPVERKESYGRPRDAGSSTPRPLRSGRQEAPSRYGRESRKGRDSR